MAREVLAKACPIAPSSLLVVPLPLIPLRNKNAVVSSIVRLYVHSSVSLLRTFMISRTLQTHTLSQSFSLPG